MYVESILLEMNWLKLSEKLTRVHNRRTINDLFDDFLFDILTFDLYLYILLQTEMDLRDLVFHIEKLVFTPLVFYRCIIIIHNKVIKRDEPCKNTATLLGFLYPHLIGDYSSFLAKQDYFQMWILKTVYIRNLVFCTLCSQLRSRSCTFLLFEFLDS